MKVGFKNSFLKALKKLKDTDLKASLVRIIEEVEGAESFQDISNLKKLKGYTVYYKIRLNECRIGLKWVEDEQIFYFVTFDHRKNIYKNFP